MRTLGRVPVQFTIRLRHLQLSSRSCLPRVVTLSSASLLSEPQCALLILEGDEALSRGERPNVCSFDAGLEF